jgi:Zn-dependent M28 family amino/carboxypeptidase
MISKTIRILIVLSMLMGVFVFAPVASADDISETQGFRKAVTLAGIREHQQAFQSIANANDGNRSSGTPGFDASAQYVFDKLAAAGYSPSFQEFTFSFCQEFPPATFEQTAPNSVAYAENVDFDVMTCSGSGDTTALVSRPSGDIRGCTAADFTGFREGDIALIQRGTPTGSPPCTFGLKTANAAAAGASGVIIFNNIPGLLLGTLGAPVADIPSIGISQALGADLLALIPAGLTVHLAADTFSEIRTTRNVIAETPTGDPNRVIVVGAHLDSVPAGPGINDNGSGSATILEVAEVFAAQGRVARNKIRFMWYGAEEFNLLGSGFYVNNLPQAERDKIELMLNFDMIGSPNFVRFVYDGNNSAGGGAVGPAGSGAIEQVFLDYFASQGLLNAPTPFNGRSDYGPFIAVGIPAGGLFTGAEGRKTAQQVIDYGGIEGAQYDPCYHAACDTFAGTGSGSGATAPGLGLTALDQMSDAVAHAVLLFSKRNFDKDPLVDPVAASALAARAAAHSDSGPHPAHDAEADQ